MLEEGSNSKLSRSEPVSGVDRIAVAMEPGVSIHMSSFDIWDRPNLFDEPHPNVLVSSPEVITDNLAWGYMFQSPMRSWKHQSMTTPVWKGLGRTDDIVVFDFQPELKRFLQSADTWLLRDYKVVTPRGQLFTEAVHLGQTDKSILIPWYTKFVDRPVMIDLSCGGYGGWSYGMAHAHEMGWPRYQIIGIDMNLHAATQHSLNHRTLLMPNQKIPLTWFLDREQSMTFHADITNMRFEQSLALANADVWSFSFPCQSWSRSAYAKGFGDENGEVLAKGLGLARLHRPRYIALENVKNFPSHPHFAVFLKLVHWCGYRMIGHRILDASERLPVSRPRWLGILQRVEEAKTTFQWMSWGNPQPSVPYHWDAWIRSSASEAAIYEPSHEEMKMYLDPKLVPPQAPAQAKIHVMNYRVPDPTSKTPVFMGSYGAHTDLPMQLLSEKGLHGFFTAEHGRIRWWKPQEVTLLHNQIMDIALMAPLKAAWRHLGNSITMHHAYVALFHALHLLHDPKPTGSLAEHIEAAERNRLKASEVSIELDEYGCYMSRMQSLQLKNRLHFLADSMHWKDKQINEWPSNHYFDPDHGCVNIHEKETGSHQTANQTRDMTSLLTMHGLPQTPHVTCPHRPDVAELTDQKHSGETSAVPCQIDLRINSVESAFSEASVPTGDRHQASEIMQKHSNPRDTQHDLVPASSLNTAAMCSNLNTAVRSSDIVTGTSEHSPDASRNLGCVEHVMPSSSFSPLDATVFPKKSVDQTLPPADSSVEHSRQATVTAANSDKIPKRAHYDTDANNTIDASDVESHQTAKRPKMDTEIMQFLIPGTYGLLKVSYDMKYADLLAMWNFSLLPCTMLQQPRELHLQEAFDLGAPVERCILAPAHIISENPHIFESSSYSPCLIADDPQGQTHVFPTSGRDWKQMKQEYPQLDGCKYDCYGNIPDAHVFKQHARVFSQHTQHVPFPDIEQLLEVCTNVSLTSRTPICTDILAVNIQGVPDAVNQIVHFWMHALDSQWQQQHGRVMNYQQVSETEAALLFRPNGNKFATPTLHLTEAIQVKLLQTGLVSMNRQQGRVDIIFKYNARGIMTIVTDKAEPVEPLQQLATHALALTAFGQVPALCSGGKRWTEAATTSDFLFSTNAIGNEYAVCHIAHPLIGGGGSKQEHRQTVHAGIASLLLDFGIPLEDVKKHVDKLQSEFGIPKLTNLLFATIPEEKPVQLKELCRQSGIQIDQSVQRMQKNAHKFAKIEHSKQGRALRNLDPQQYNIQPGHFTTQDGNPIPINPTFSPYVSGITMVTPSQAEQWLKSPSKIHADELGLFVVGDLHIDTKEHEKLTVPATNLANQPCLIAGYWVQLGEKRSESRPKRCQDHCSRSQTFRSAPSRCGNPTLQNKNGTRLFNHQSNPQSCCWRKMGCETCYQRHLAEHITKTGSRAFQLWPRASNFMPLFLPISLTVC